MIRPPVGFAIGSLLGGPYSPAQEDILRVTKLFLDRRGSADPRKLLGVMFVCAGPFRPVLDWTGVRLLRAKRTHESLTYEAAIDTVTQEAPGVLGRLFGLLDEVIGQASEDYARRGFPFNGPAHAALLAEVQRGLGNG